MTQRERQILNVGSKRSHDPQQELAERAGITGPAWRCTFQPDEKGLHRRKGLHRPAAPYVTVVGAVEHGHRRLAP